MTKLFIGNWKAYLPDDEAVSLAGAYAEAAASCRGWEIAVAPSFTALERAARELAGTGVELAAQDGFWEDRGAFTGEIPMTDLAALGVRYVIVGHSERRSLRGVDDATVAKQAAAAARHGLVPVICVGETTEEREAGRKDDVVRRQLEAALLDAPSPDGIVVAYEPRWAIGTGTPCRPEDAFETLRLIRAALRERYGPEAGDARVLYGGSVDAGNLQAYARESGFDGVLVGGASVKPEQVRSMLCGS